MAKYYYRMVNHIANIRSEINTDGTMKSPSELESEKNNGKKWISGIEEKLKNEEACRHIRRLLDELAGSCASFQKKFGIPVKNPWMLPGIKGKMVASSKNKMGFEIGSYIPLFDTEEAETAKDSYDFLRSDVYKNKELVALSFELCEPLAAQHPAYKSILEKRKQKYQEIVDKHLQACLESDNLGEDAWRFLEREFLPNDYRPTWNILKIKTKNFTDIGQEDNGIGSLEEDLEERLEGVRISAERILKIATPLAERAISLAGEDREKLKAAWNYYRDRLIAKRDKKVQELKDKIESRDKANAKAIREAKAAAERKGWISLLFALLFIGIAAGITTYAYHIFAEPRKLINCMRLAFYAAAAGGTILSGIAGVKITRRLKEDRNAKYHYKKLCSSIINKSPTVIKIISAASLGLFLASAITFYDRVGTIELASAEDMKKVKWHSYGEFVVVNDIDFKNSELPEVDDFHGTIDGRGHTFSNLTLDTRWIDTNTGTIQNLVFENPDFRQSWIYRNGGLISGVRFKNMALSGSYGLIESNSGEIEKITVLNCEIKENVPAVILRSNGRDGIVRNCTVENVDISMNTPLEGESFSIITNFNHGTVENCTVKADLSNFNGTVFGTIVGESRDGIIRGCRFEGSLTPHSISNMSKIGGICGYSRDTDIRENDVHADFHLKIDGNKKLESAIGGICGKFISGTPWDASWLSALNIYSPEQYYNLNDNHATADFNVSSDNSPNSTVYLGGVVGICNYGTITGSSWHGTVQARSLREKDGIALRLGGLCAVLQKSSATDSYSAGSIAFQEGDFRYIWAGGIAGTGDSSSTVQNCYADMEFQIAGLGTGFEIAGILLDDIGSSSVKNSFYNGRMAVKDSNHKWLYPIRGHGSPENSYYNEKVNEKWMIQAEKRGTAVSGEQFYSADFIRKTLGWSDKVWNITDGVLPSLKSEKTD